MLEAYVEHDAGVALQDERKFINDGRRGLKYEHSDHYPYVEGFKVIRMLPSFDIQLLIQILGQQ